MNWDAISTISDAAGVLAVIIALGYLPVRIRYARLTVMDENRLGRSEGVLAIANDPVLARLCRRATETEIAITKKCSRNYQSNGTTEQGSTMPFKLTSRTSPHGRVLSAASSVPWLASISSACAKAPMRAA